MDAKAFGKQLAELMKTAVRKGTEPLEARVLALEARLNALEARSDEARANPEEEAG